MIDARPAGPLAVVRDVLRLRRQAERGHVAAEQPRDRDRRQPVEHQVVGEVGERVADGRKLPVEDRDDTRLARVKHHVIDPVVAVDDRRRLLDRRQVFRQPLNQSIHRLDAPGRLVLEVLLRPAGDLPGHVGRGLAEIGEPNGGWVEPVQVGKRADECQRVRVSRRPLDRLERGIPEDPAVDVFHHVEPGADDGLVGTKRVRLRHRHAAAAERPDDPEFPVHRVRGGEQRARRLAPEHVALSRRFEQVSRIRLATLELPHHDRTFEPRDVGIEVGGQAACIDLHAGAHVGCRCWRAVGWRLGSHARSGPLRRLSAPALCVAPHSL